VDQATTFDGIYASGEKFGEVMGEKAPRAFVMLAMVAMGNTAAGMATTLPKLPGAGQAAVVAGTQLNIRFTAPALAQVESVALSAEGVTLALAPNAVAMAAQVVGGGSGGPAGKGSLTGHPTRPGPNDRKPENISALQRENESARTLADNGYHVEQNPLPKPNGKKPDYRINGEYYDCYAPNSSSVRNIATNVAKEKVRRDQADRIILNLDDTSVEIEAIKKQLVDWPISGLKEVIAIKNGSVVPVLP
jgi:hypothetical protein